MDRKRLQRQLRRAARLGRYAQSVQARLEKLCKELSITPQELELLVKEHDGYLLVCDARDEGSHVTLSDASEIAKKRARDREDARVAANKKAREERAKQVKIEQAERKAHKIKKQKEAMLEMVKSFAAVGMTARDLGIE